MEFPRGSFGEVFWYIFLACMGSKNPEADAMAHVDGRTPVDGGTRVYLKALFLVFIAAVAFFSGRALAGGARWVDILVLILLFLGIVISSFLCGWVVAKVVQWPRLQKAARRALVVGLTCAALAGVIIWAAADISSIPDEAFIGAERYARAGRGKVAAITTRSVLLGLGALVIGGLSLYVVERSEPPT